MSDSKSDKYFSKSSRSSSSKRKRGNPSLGGGGANPQRGNPGIILTCETGREGKCKREGMEILQYYHHHQQEEEKSNRGEQHNETSNEKRLSLEDEIAAVQQKQQEQDKNSSIFEIYNTGCRGTITVICTLKDSALIPTFCKYNDEHNNNKNNEQDQTAGSSNKEGVATTNDGNKKQENEGDKDSETTIRDTIKGQEKPSASQTVEPAPKKLKTDAGVGNNTSALTDTPETTEVKNKKEPKDSWDPIQTVENIMNDLRQKNKTAPSSRFVTRMIPVQATCFANKEEMCHTARQLWAKFGEGEENGGADPGPANQNKHQDEEKVLKQDLPTTSDRTFAIVSKRRNCSHLSSKEIIDVIAQQAPAGWKVDLKEPQYTMVVEVLRTLCGMSLIRDCPKRFHKFNILELREANEEKEEEGGQDGS